MTTESETPQRDSAAPPQTAQTPPVPLPALPAAASSIPQKRVLIDDDHAPAVRSPLNPDSKPAKASTASQAHAQDDTPSMAREKRTKKETLKKRESKGPLSAADSHRGTPEPRRKEAKDSRVGAEAYPVRVKLHGPLRPSDFDLPQGPVFRSHHKVAGPDGREIEFFETSEHPLNRKGYVYEAGIADPGFPSSLYYRQSEPKPHGAHFSFEDPATHIFFDQSGLHVTGDHGFRMARANIAAREGRWYWECKITRGCVKNKSADGPESHGHVRMGWARREASRDAPVGYDAYSYGLRDVSGQKVHMSRPKEFFPPGEDVQEGDVVGLEIQLPSEHLHRKVVQGSYNPAVDLVDAHARPTAEGPNVVRDRIPFRFQTTKLCFEKFDYHTIKELEDLMNPSPMTSSGPPGSAETPNPNHPVPCLRTLPGSHIKIYKNGVLMGTAFTDLLAFLPPASSANSKVQEGAREGLDDGSLGYYPAVSVFRGGAAEVNFGPRFWFPPPGLDDASSAGDDNDDVVMIDVGDPPPPPPPRAQPAALTQLRPASDRYDEQIVEDIVFDIVDEVHFWMQDGGRAPTVPPRDEAKEAKDIAMED